MAVGFAVIPLEIVGVLVMGIVNVTVRVLHRFVGMKVLVSFGQV